MRRFRVLVGVLIVGVAGCGVNPEGEVEPPVAPLLQAAKGMKDPGALVRVTMDGQVGVLLDDLPANQRARVATRLLAKAASFWTARAQRQVEHTNYRLIYRAFFYKRGKQMMPITRPEQWDFTLDLAGARRVTFQGHDVVSIRFKLSTTVLTDEASPGAAEPLLAQAGGTWDEPYSLPLDPEFLYQRTGRACVDEDGYPLGTADSENVRNLFDSTCKVEKPGKQACHLTLPLPQESCEDALTRATGRVDTALHFERLVWSGAVANTVRTGAPIRATADLTPRLDGLQENRIVYRYIPANSCAIEERCVGGPGWRRLLQFTASIQNKGARPLVVGSTDPASLMSINHDFEFSACHGHYHFSHYGDFQFGAFPGDKRAFCVESTARWFNNEQVPLLHPYSCDNQGVETGWGDDYIAGVECQWVDITDLPAPRGGNSTTLSLSFEFNPDRFLCEGTPVTNGAGTQLFEPTPFVTEAGEPVNRPKCNFEPGTLANNLASTLVTIPTKGGLVTAACARDQFTGLRDCGFQEAALGTCTPGAQVTLRCAAPADAQPQVMRVCEASTTLGGTACVYRDALAHADVFGAASTVTFKCPIARDASERGGRYAIYTGAMVEGDAAVAVSCK